VLVSGYEEPEVDESAMNSQVGLECIGSATHSQVREQCGADATHRTDVRIKPSRMHQLTNALGPLLDRRLLIESSVSASSDHQFGHAEGTPWSAGFRGRRVTDWV
jgi:hypothetical protein